MTRRYIFTNVIAAGPVDWKRSLTAKGQPAIRECFMIFAKVDADGMHGEHAEINNPGPSELAKYSDEIAGGAVVVGHSVEYHHGHLRATMIPWGIDPCDGRTKTICTMLSLTGHVPKRNGRKGWPTFGECCDFFCITRARKETSEDNARCLVQVFQGMLKIRDMPELKTWKERTHG